MQQQKSIQRGVVLAETAIFLPIVLFTMFSLMEIGCVLNIDQKISYHSRELANVTFRECYGFDNVTISGTRYADECLQERIIDGMNPAITAALPGTKFLISMYEVTTTGAVLVAMMGTLPARYSRVTAAEVSSHATTLGYTTRVVVTETFYLYSPMLPTYFRSLSNPVRYAATLM